MVKVKKTENLKEKNEELLNDLKRLQAEFDNYRKREEKLAVDNIKLANKALMKDLLQVLDNFELALKATESESGKKGLELIYGQFSSILEEFGLKKMQVLGKIFDPEIHEAMLIEENKEPKNTIIEVFQEGYFLNEKILRQARVKLSGGKK